MTMITLPLLLAVATSAAATPLASWHSQLGQQEFLGPPSVPDYRLCLPAEDSYPTLRSKDIEFKRQGFLYGQSLLGNSSFYPTGKLGDALSKYHQDLWYKDVGWLVQTVAEELAVAVEETKKAGGISDIADYQNLYHGHWQHSVPNGVAQGALANYSSDLLFAMERLSTNPYSIRRLHPTKDKLSFLVDPLIVHSLTGTTLLELHRTGRLFYVDHSYQKDYPVTANRYTAACQAYFFFDLESKQLSPLAIKTNVGTDLIYTPLDEENDWLLAKAMFNQNDLFHGQIFHLASSHAVVEIVHQAALRTMATNHPVLAFLNRLTFQAYAIRPVGETVLFNDGGFFDQVFALNNHAVRKFATDFYPTVAGGFQSNYFERDLVDRGLLDCEYGPKLPFFPFYDDGSRLLSAMRNFAESYVDAYYESNDAILHDWELQSWMNEANGPALVIDFPSSPIDHRTTLIDIITHMSWLTGVAHHVLNAGEPVATSGALPLHPAALYAPPPTQKGVGSLLPFLPDLQAAAEQIALLARFNRPTLSEKQQTLLYMFADPVMLEQEVLIHANERYMADMHGISKAIRAKSFDEHGLSQGMPFIWQGLDPAEIPFFLSV